MKIENIKDEFPIFDEKIQNNDLVYLDSANSSQKPKVVADKINEFYTKQFSNVGRSVHYLAVAATNLYENTRSSVQKYINAKDKNEIAFTKGATTHLSNVTGAILPVKEITDLAHSKGIIVVIDGCQGAPHLKLDMQDLDCDFYAISCHKMYGPTGLGVLYGKKKWLEELPPYQGGGGMIREVKKDKISYGDLPNKYEAGTMATAQVIAFDQSIKFMESIGIENIMKHEADLVEYGQELLQKNNSVKLIGSPKNKGGVLSFTLEGVHPHDIATILDEDGVAIRAGHHCCQILHDKLNIPASARASVGIYNTKDDLDKLNDSINNCKKIFNLK